MRVVDWVTLEAVGAAGSISAKRLSFVATTPDASKRVSSCPRLPARERLPLATAAAAAGGPRGPQASELCVRPDEAEAHRFWDREGHLE